MHPWKYLGSLSLGRYVLWCYFIWWCVVLVRYFDPNPTLWLTTLGLTVIIGVALVINASSGGVKPQPWQVFRFFVTPFCVSSFASLAKGRGFFLVFSPDWRELAATAAIWVVLGVLTLAARKHQAGPTPPA